jgi:two-component system cell cycle sensor histidine kinase/response regulator CckA
MSLAQGSSYKQDLLALTVEKERRYALPVLVSASLLSAAIIFAALNDWIIATGFAAAVLGLAALVYALRPSEPVATTNRELPPDWSVARAAANASGLAMAITDHAGRLVCASDLYGEWFSDWPAPSALPLGADALTALVQAGRVALRDGEGRCDGLTFGVMKLEAHILRTGRSDDYLLWHFVPVRQSTLTEDFTRIISGEAGAQLGDAGLMAALIGPEGRVRSCNDAFLIRATGRLDADLTGRDFAELFRKDEQGRIFFQREALSSLPVAVFKAPLKGDQSDSAALVMLIDQPGDATLGGSSLSYLQALFALMPVGVAVADRDGRLLSLNSVFGRAVNIPDGETPAYPGDLVVAEDQAALATAVRRYAVGPQMSGDIAVRLRNQPEEPVAFSLSGVRGLGEAAVVITLKDDNEEGRLKRQVAQATKMQAVGQLAGGVAHDFNNILTAIIGYCDLMLMRHTPGDSDYDDIQHIKSNSNRAASLTRQLLAFSRQQTLRPQVIQLPDIVSDVSSLLKRLIGENVKLEVTHGRNLGHVRADPGQIEQVIVNLAVNARDAMPDGGILSIKTFSVTAAQARELRSTVLPAADYTGLTISDTGTGIPPEILPKIFEPFFTTKEIGKGTGLGLSTVYGIVKQSGGYIFADSQLGQGTSFSVYLPVHLAGMQDKEPASIKSVPSSRGDWATGTIVLVEDEDMVRAVAERALTRQGYVVVTASDGEQGLEVLDELEHVDLLLSDVVMPNMDGPAMARQARVKRPNLPVLFMSGYAEEQLRKSIDMDNVSFLPKPFSVAQLSEAVVESFAAAQNRGEM